VINLTEIKTVARTALSASKLCLHLDHDNKKSSLATTIPITFHDRDLRASSDVNTSHCNEAR
jgi:hypothetical protein